MPAPTEMKNRPSSRPLKGSMSPSSSWRYSLSASTTPARKVPSAGLSPTACISSAMPTTSSSAAAVNTSRSFVLAMARKTGRTRKRPPPTIAATAASTTSACCQPGSAATPWASPPAADVQRREQRQHRQDRDDGDVLGQQDREDALPGVGSQAAGLGQALEHDRGRRHRDDEADGQRRLARRCRAATPTSAASSAVPSDLRAAEPEDRDAHAPQHRGPQLEADEEQHHHDAELGEVQDVLAALGDEAQAERPDDDAGEQVAEHGAQAEPPRDRHGGDGGGEIDEGLQQDVVVHHASPRTSLTRSAAAARARSSVPSRSRASSVRYCRCAGQQPVVGIQRVRAVHHERREVRHATQERGLVERRQQLAHREPVASADLVGRLGPAGGRRVDEHLAFERTAGRSVGEAVLEHQVEVLLHERGGAVPVERMLQDDDVVRDEPALLGGDVDLEVRVGLVQVVDRDALEIADRLEEAAVDARLLEGGVREQHQHAGHGGGIIACRTVPFR